MYEKSQQQKWERVVIFTTQRRQIGHKIKACIVMNNAEKANWIFLLPLCYTGPKINKIKEENMRLRK